MEEGLAGQDPAPVGGQVLEELELLVGQVEDGAAQAGRVRRRVDDEVADLDAVLVDDPLLGAARAQQAQPRGQLGRGGVRQQSKRRY